MSDTPLPTVPPEVLQAFSDALAQSIVVQAPVAEQPLVEVGDTGGNGFALNVTYSGVVYSLTVSMPAKEGDPYLFTVSMKKGKEDPVDLVTFKYASTKDWSLTANTPKIVAGPVTINKLSIDIGATKEPPKPPEDVTT